MAEKTIIDEVAQAIDNINYGSVEVIVQNGEVTQISTRIIKKTKIVSATPKNASSADVRKSRESGINLNFKY